MNKQTYDTVIVGLGKTGLSCVRHLLRQGKRDIAVLDTRVEPPELSSLQESCAGVPVHLGGLDEAILYQAQEIILSPGLSINEPVIQQAISMGASVSGDVEVFCQHVTKPIIAVTGSNGKSTVVTLVGEMIRTAGLKVELGGNIGIPVLDLLELNEPDFYVLELSSFQLETISSLDAVASVVLNISEDHMDRYPGMDSYVRAKRLIYKGEGVIVFNREQQVSSSSVQNTGRTCISYGMDKPEKDMFGLQVFGKEYWLVQGEQKLLPESELKIQGKHNLSNALAALALGTSIKLPMDAMLNTLRQFGGLSHRCQFVTRFRGVSWYNDSKATNVGATCAAIEGLSSKSKIILIAGGEGKGADFSPLVESVRDRVRSVILIGRDASRLETILEKVVPVCFAINIEVAVSTAAKLAKEGEIVLLSPACASFDMFVDYQARGEAFVEAIRIISQEDTK